VPMSPNTTPNALMTRICVFSLSLWPILPGIFY
jgi:hypothetical protein